MKIRIVGGGPAGLFFAYLMARADSGHEVATRRWRRRTSDSILLLRGRE